MNTPVTHGSGTVIVTATGSGTELGKISGLLTATAKEQSPLTRELNVLSLWVAAAAGVTMMVMFAFGRYRGQAWDALFVSAVSLAIAAIPEALPTVTQVILSLGSVELAKRNAIVKDLPSVETLGFTSAINSDKTGTLTMNQMTAVEVIAPGNSYTISGTGYSLEGRVEHTAGSSETIDDAILPYLVANDAKLVDGKVVGDPTEGALLVLAHKAGLDVDATRERTTPAGDPALRPDLQADGHLQPRRRPVRIAGRALLRQGGGPGGDGPGGNRTFGRPEHPLGRRPGRPGRVPHGTDGARGSTGDGGGGPRPRPDRLRPDRRPALLCHRSANDQPGRHGRPSPRRIQEGGGGRPGRSHPRPHGHRRRRDHRRRHRRAAGHSRPSPSWEPISPPSPKRSGWPASTTSEWSDASLPSTRSCWPTPSRKRATWWP